MSNWPFYRDEFEGVRIMLADAQPGDLFGMLYQTSAGIKKLIVCTVVEVVPEEGMGTSDDGMLNSWIKLRYERDEGRMAPGLHVHNFNPLQQMQVVG